MKRAALYVRVSTDEQTTENQIVRLHEVAAARGWQIVCTYDDAGISGSKRSDQRPGLSTLLKDASRRAFDVLMVWSIDRLGRSLSDLLNTMEHLHTVNVDLYFDQQAIDTTTPMGRFMFQVTGAFAQFEREMIRARIAAGIARARAQGKRVGRLRVDLKRENQVKDFLSQGKGIRATARLAGVGVSVVQRIKREDRAEAA